MPRTLSKGGAEPGRERGWDTKEADPQSPAPTSGASLWLCWSRSGAPHPAPSAHLGPCLILPTIAIGHPARMPKPYSARPTRCPQVGATASLWSPQRAGRGDTPHEAADLGLPLALTHPPCPAASPAGFTSTSGLILLNSLHVQGCQHVPLSPAYTSAVAPLVPTICLCTPCHCKPLC